MKNLLKEAKRVAKHYFKNFKIADSPERKEAMKIRGYDMEKMLIEK